MTGLKGKRKNLERLSIARRVFLLNFPVCNAIASPSVACCASVFAEGSS